MQISNFRLGIGCPVNFPMVPCAFFDSFIAMEKPDFVYLRASQGPIEGMRNELVQQALEIGCSHLAMLDTDQVYPTDTITKMLSHKALIVGTLIFRRYPPFDPLLLRGKIDGYSTVPEAEWDSGKLVPVDATGAGCWLFDMEIFRVMPYPWFRFRVAASGGTIGEDFGFCADLRARGYEILVDTSVEVGHLSRMVVNKATHRLYRMLKASEAKAAHEVSHGELVTKL